MSRQREADDFMRLHAPVRGRGRHSAAPALREGFVVWLDRASGTQGDARPGTPSTPLTMTQAWQRLRAAYPLQAEAVEHTIIDGRTVRAVARELGVCHRTVCERRRAGVARLVIWSNVSEVQVVAALRAVA